MSHKQDKTDSVQVQKSTPTVIMATAQFSSTIDYKELQIGKLVGSGEFAGWFNVFIDINRGFFCLIIIEVYEGIYRKSRVAIKILKEANSSALFLREAEIMR